MWQISVFMLLLNNSVLFAMSLSFPELKHLIVWSLAISSQQNEVGGRIFEPYLSIFHQLMTWNTDKGINYNCFTDFTCLWKCHPVENPSHAVNKWTSLLIRKTNQCSSRRRKLSEQDDLWQEKAQEEHPLNYKIINLYRNSLGTWTNQ